MNKKEFIETLIDMGGCGAKPETWSRGWDDAISEVLGIAEELDEPETLSQEWIDENKVARINNVRKMTTSDVVPVEKLKNLLVPKQDKPVIPQFVVDYYKDYEYLELTFEEWFECEEFGKGGKTENKTFEWLLDNSHEVNIERQFILADIIAHGLDGYEVEKEPQWVVTFNWRDIKLYFSRFCNVEVDDVEMFEPDGYEDKNKKLVYRFFDKEKAEAVALLVGGDVEEVTE